MTGTALLDEEGKYKLSIGEEENRLLRILQQQTKGEFQFTNKAADRPKGEIFSANAYSFSAEDIGVKTKTNYADNKFKFDVEVKIRVVLTELMFPIDMRNDEKKMAREIEQQFDKKFAKFIAKVQKAKIDPIGLGLHARAFEYEHWKPVQKRWGEELANADVNVKVKVEIAAMGTTK